MGSRRGQEGVRGSGVVLCYNMGIVVNNASHIPTQLEQRIRNVFTKEIKHDLKIKVKGIIITHSKYHTLFHKHVELLHSHQK
jgi:hypothetical protein